MPETSRRRWVAYFELIRAPNVFTAAADILAGFFHAGGWFEDWTILLRLACASMCFYAAGMALNDLCDIRVDTIERPNRPLPSGRIAIGPAVQLILILFIAGLSLAFSVSIQSGLIASLLIAAIVVYDVLLKRTFAAPLVMGSCRALNLCLGMYGITDFTSMAALRPVAIVLLYVTALTFFARTEARESSRLRLILGLAGIMTAFAGFWWIRRWTANARYPEFVWLLGGLAAWVLYNGLRAVSRPEPRHVQLAVKRFLVGLVLLDACIAWSVSGPEAAVIVAGVLIPFLVLARFFSTT